MLWPVSRIFTGAARRHRNFVQLQHQGACRKRRLILLEIRCSPIRADGCRQRSTGISCSPQARAAARLLSGHVPQLLQAIELAYPRQHHMHDHVAARSISTQSAILLAFDAVRPENRLLWFSPPRAAPPSGHADRRCRWRSPCKSAMSVSPRTSNTLTSKAFMSSRGVDDHFLEVGLDFLGRRAWERTSRRAFWGWRPFSWRLVADLTGDLRLIGTKWCSGSWSSNGCASIRSRTGSGIRNRGSRPIPISCRTSVEEISSWVTA